MNELLDEIESFLEDHMDVVDGSYGEPRPNRAMQLYADLKAARASHGGQDWPMGDPHPCDMTPEERERFFAPSSTASNNQRVAGSGERQNSDEHLHGRQAPAKSEVVPAPTITSSATAGRTDIEPFRDELMNLLGRWERGALEVEVFAKKIEGVLKAIRSTESRNDLTEEK